MRNRSAPVASLEADQREQGRGFPRLILALVGAGLLAATGAIHLDLYLTGYRTIPTIGRLFSIQVIAAFVLAGAVLVSRNRLAPVAGAGFSVATLGGYLLSLRISLFGFREVRTAAGVVAGVIEIVAFAVLAALVLSPLRPTAPAKGGGSRFDGSRRAIVVARWAAAALSATAALLFVISLAASGPASTSAGPSRAVLMVAKIRGVQVLTNARGYTLYWFAPDTPTKSTCYGTCAVYWPPVTTRRPPAGSGLTGDLGTITRSGGATQVTYDGHPLYAYVGDSAPRQSNGNNINLNGGLWHEMAATD